MKKKSPKQATAARKARPARPAKPAARTKPRPKPAQLSGDELFRSLPPKQQQFCLEYLANGFNASAAAKKAGYAAAHADTQGSRLLANPKIAAVIAERAGKLTKKREITAERVLDEIAKMAFFDPRRMFRPDGSLIPIGQLDEETAAAIAGLDVKELYADKCPIGQLKKIKIADKRGSLELLGRYLKLFTDKVEHSGSLGVQLITTVPRPQRKALPKKET